MSSRQILTALLLAIGIAFVARQSLSVSKLHGFPVYDEITYLENAREMQQEGGIIKIIGSYLSGRNQESNRNPLHLMLLSLLFDQTPADFARAKLLTLFQLFVLIGVVFVLAGRRWGWDVGLFSALLVAFSGATSNLSHYVLADVLLALCFFAGILKMMELDESPRGWLIAGVWAGLAYLTKGSGHFLLLSGVAVAVYRLRSNVVKGPQLYLMAAAFLVTAAFLLIRNIRLYDTLFYNVNNKAFWLDNWPQYLLLPLTPAWDEVGLLWYWKHHSLLQMALKIWGGIMANGLLLLESLSFLPFSNPWRFVPGVLLLAAGIRGIWLRWRGGFKQEIIAFAAANGALFLAYSFFFERTVRYLYHITVCFMPFVAVGILTLLPRSATEKWIFKLRWAFGVILGVILLGLVKADAVLIAQNPVSFWRVPDYWRRTGEWIHEHVDENGFVMDSRSYYSSWFLGENKMQPASFGGPAEVVQFFIRAKKVRFALVDQPMVASDPYQDKYGPADEYGPTSFLGWKRCFTDGEKPSRFLIYCAVNESEKHHKMGKKER